MTVQTIDLTPEVLADMLTENTGIHMMDSGGGAGRMWQRNAGRTVDDWQARPAAYFDTFGGYPTLDLFHFLKDRVTYDERLSRHLSIFGEQDEYERESWLGIASEYADHMHDGTGTKYDRGTYNSYNDDQFLSQDFQWETFTYDNEYYIALSIHGGADIRGGYTKPRVFRVDDGWYYDCCNADIYCTNDECEDTSEGGRSSSWQLMGPRDVISCAGTSTDELDHVWDDVKDGQPKCPKCGSDLAIEAPYYSGW